MKTRTTMTILTLAVCAATGLSDAIAREATVSDFAICNQEAATAAGGAASPGVGAPRPGRPPAVDPPGGPPMPPAPPDVGPSTPGTQPGLPNAGAAARAPRAAEGTDPTGRIIAKAPDPLMLGMAADRADDPAYRSAYRACMTRRGITTDVVAPAR